MGASVSGTSNLSNRFSVNDLLNEKEYIFLVLQSEIDSAICKKQKRELYRIGKEISVHIHELKDLLKYRKWKKETTERIQRLIYNYQISIGKVRSIFNTLPKRAAPKVNADIGTETITVPPTITDTGDISSTVASKESEISEETNEECETNTNLIDFSGNDDVDFEDEPTYVNIEDLDSFSSLSRSESFGPIKKKAPVPVPRNKQDMLVKEVPNYLARLEEILEKDDIDSNDVEEVLNIRKKTNEVKNIFLAKIDEIFKRYEDGMVDRLKNQ